MDRSKKKKLNQHPLKNKKEETFMTQTYALERGKMQWSWGKK